MKKKYPFGVGMNNDSAMDPLELLIMHQAFEELTDDNVYSDDEKDPELDMEEAGKEMD